MNNELLIIKKLEKYIDKIIDEQKKAEIQLVREIINTQDEYQWNGTGIESNYYKLLPNVLFSHTLGKTKEVEQLLNQIYITDDFWDRFTLDKIDIHDKKIQGNLAETAVDILLRDNDDYIINVGKDVLTTTLVPDKKYNVDEYLEKIMELKEYKTSTKTIILKPKYQKNWNGDFGIYDGEKLLGYFDIKYTNFFDIQKNDYRNDDGIIEDVILKGIKGKEDWSSVDKIITYILQSLTFDFKQGYKNNSTNRELIYIFRDGGYWSSEVLTIMKPALLNYLKKQINNY